MAHGFTGDKSEWGRFDKTAEAFNEAGYNVLAFDFSGSGESDDDSLTVGKQVDDLNCAIKFVLDKGFEDIGLLGLSLGGLVSLKTYSPEKNIETMVLWAPVTAKKENYVIKKKFSPEELKELREKGYITKIMEAGVRKKIIIDKQMIYDRETVDQKELLSNIDCPILIIHGNQDESVPLEDSKRAIKYLSPESKLEIIEEADHQFTEQLDTIISLTTNWFKQRLS
ncbi:alpha/beta hydrolase [Patescibacteria group bacterium]|nr:alpha/beta hydrolase [Patescibacteria group bacterium]